MGTLSTALQIARGTSRTVTAPPAQRATHYLGGLAVTHTGLQLATSERDYQHTAVAYRCVALIAQNLASVPMTVMLGDEARDDHPMAVLWNRGNASAGMSARVVREILFARLELTGEAFAYIDRGDTGTGAPRAVHPIFDTVRVVTDREDSRTNGRVLGYVIKTPSGDVGLLPSEVLWLRYPHPEQRWGSLAPWKAARFAVDADAYARAWQRAEFKNGARPSMFINLGEVSDEVYEGALAAIRTRVEGADNAGRSMVVKQQPGSTARTEVQQLSMSPQEMSYLETRVANADEVALAFGVHPDLLRGGSTYENRAAAKTDLWSDKLVPKLDVIASEFDRQLLPSDREHAAWDLTDVDALRESQDALIERAGAATEHDVVTIDEARAMLGLDPLPMGQGAYTITPYRARAQLTARQEFGVLLSTPSNELPRMIRSGGRTFTPRPQRRANITEDDVLAAYDRHERIGKRAVERLAERQEKAVLKQLQSITRKAPDWPEQRRAELQQLRADGQLREDEHGAWVDHSQRIGASDLFDVQWWRDETIRALEDFAAGVWGEAGQRTASLLDVSWDHLDPLVLDAMHARLDELAGRVTSTTRAALDSAILQEGVIEGESIEQLSRRLRKVFSDLSTWRAETIARTEVVGGYNAAAHQVAAHSGQVVQRVWHATADSRTRPSHARQHGHVVRGTDTLYPNGCRFPGDPNGPAGETINCRCVELFDTEGDA